MSTGRKYELGPRDDLFLLMVAMAHPKPLTSADIQAEIGVHESGVSRYLAPLEDAGYIRRGTRPGSGTTKNIHLNPERAPELIERFQQQIDNRTIALEALRSIVGDRDAQPTDEGEEAESRQVVLLSKGLRLHLTIDIEHIEEENG